MTPESDVHCSESASDCVLWLESSLLGLHWDKTGIVMRALCDARVCSLCSFQMTALDFELLSRAPFSLTGRANKARHRYECTTDTADRLTPS